MWNCMWNIIGVNYKVSDTIRTKFRLHHGLPQLHRTPPPAPVPRVSHSYQVDASPSRLLSMLLQMYTHIYSYTLHLLCVSPVKGTVYCTHYAVLQLAFFHLTLCLKSRISCLKGKLLSVLTYPNSLFQPAAVSLPSLLFSKVPVVPETKVAGHKGIQKTWSQALYLRACYAGIWCSTYYLSPSQVHSFNYFWWAIYNPLSQALGIQL